MGRVLRRAREFMHGVNQFDDESRVDSSWEHGHAMSHDSGARTTAPRIFRDRSMITSIYVRLAMDVAMVDFIHCKLDQDNDVPIERVRSVLDERLNLRANIDQTAFQMKFDAAMTMFLHETVVLAPIETTYDINQTDSYDIQQLRVGTVSSWYPRRVMVNVYDDREVDSKGNPVNGGIRKDLMFHKDQVAIVQNPFAGVMNSPNGTMQRLMDSWSLLDQQNQDVASGKLDMLIQLPYVTRGLKRQAMAKQRREDLREQLKGDELGIGYIDASEKVIQLNRPVNNTLPEQIDALYTKALDQLGLTPGIMNGSASADELNAYYDRTIEPIATALQQELKYKFLTQNARTRRHSIELYRDPLKLIPIGDLADVTDSLLRNAAITANELRPKIGYFPSKQPSANMLVNPNMPADKQAVEGLAAEGAAEGGDELDTELAGLEGVIDEMLTELG
jgi:hypothetical protein